MGQNGHGWSLAPSNWKQLQKGTSTYRIDKEPK